MDENDMAHRITRESLRSAGACYTDAQIEGLVPEGGLTPAEVAARVQVPAKDRHWALCCAASATDAQLRIHAVWCARRALALVPEPDPRSIAACDVAEAYARGEASESDLRAARSDAYTAAYAASTSAYTAAYAASTSAYAAYAASDAASDADAAAAAYAAASDAFDAAADAAYADAAAYAAADAYDAYAADAVFWEAAVADLASRLS